VYLLRTEDNFFSLIPKGIKFYIIKASLSS